MIYGGVGTPTAQHPKALRQRENVGVGTPSPCIFFICEHWLLEHPAFKFDRL